jgi:hypothetical protein
MRTRGARTWALLLVATIASVVACGNDAETATPNTTADPKAEAMARLAGRYGHYDVVAYDGGQFKTLIISFGFTDLTVEDGALVSQESFCHADQASNQPIKTSISDAATSAIKPIPVAVTVSTDEEGRVRIQRPPTPTGVGIRLDDPANDPLPDDPDDPRIVDDDDDGNPGITVHIEVTEDLQGDLFIARREIFAYDMTEQPDGTLVGTVDDNSEQLIIGATNEMFAIASDWVQHPDPSKSPILLVPVDPNLDCAGLMAARDDLFPPNPTVDF